MSQTTSNFSAMLAQVNIEKLLKAEIIKRDWLLSNVDKDDSWVFSGGDNVQPSSISNGVAGGPLIVRFKGAQASSQKMGGLTYEGQIASARYVQGLINVQPETWGSLLFYHKDIMVHGALSKENFLDVLEDNLTDFISVMKNNISTALLEGPAYCSLTAAVSHTTDTTGTVYVDRPDRLEIGQKVLINVAPGETSPLPIVGYVKTIDLNDATAGVNAGKVILTSDAGLTTVIDFTGAVKRDNGTGTPTAGTALAADLPAGSTQLFMDGVFSNVDGSVTACVILNQFSNLKSMLLPAANSGSSGAGSAALYGVTKVAYPYTQAIFSDGSGAAATTLMKFIFNQYTRTRKYGKGEPNKVIMSYNNLAVCMAIIENQKGAFNIVPNSKKVSQFGYTEIQIGSVTGEMLSLVGIQEKNDDWIGFIDTRALKFFSNGMFRKHKTPDGIEYYTQRDPVKGYYYIVDIALFGDLVLLRPSYCGILANLPAMTVT